MWDQITYPLPNGKTAKVWEWIRHRIPCLILDIFTYPCWDFYAPFMAISWWRDLKLTVHCEGMTTWQGILKSVYPLYIFTTLLRKAGMIIKDIDGLVKTAVSPGPCLTTAIWRCRKNSSQWQRRFQWKLHFHWLKFLRQRHVAVVRQGPVR